MIELSETIGVWNTYLCSKIKSKIEKQCVGSECKITMKEFREILWGHNVPTKLHWQIIGEMKAMGLIEVLNKQNILVIGSKEGSDWFF